MRLCLVTPAPFPIDRRAYREASTLLAAGHSVVVVCRGGPGAPDYDRIDGIDVRRIDPESTFTGATGVLSGARYVATLVHPAWRDAIEDLHERAGREAAADRDADGDPDDPDAPSVPEDFGDPAGTTAAGDDRAGLDAIHVHGLPLVKAALAAGEANDLPVVADLRGRYPEAVRQRRGRWRARDRLTDPRALAQRAFLFPWRLGRLEAACVDRVDRLVVGCEEARAHYVRERGADPADVIVVRDTLASVPDREAVPDLVPASAPATDAATIPFEFGGSATTEGGAARPGRASREPGAVGAETVPPRSEPGDGPVGTVPTGDLDTAADPDSTADPDALAETTDRDALADPPDSPNAPFDHDEAFVVVAREEFARDRGLDTLVEAAALAAENLVDLRLVILGVPRPDGEGDACRRDLGTLARRRLIGGRTLLAQVADPEHAAAHVAASDALVLPQPSTPHAETTVPQALYAALAGGTPVVATDAAPQCRVVFRTGAGRVVSPDDPDAMAAALTEIDRESGEAFGANARAAVETGGAFDHERDAARLRELYEGLREPAPPTIDIG